MEEIFIQFVVPSISSGVEWRNINCGSSKLQDYSSRIRKLCLLHILKLLKLFKFVKIVRIQ